MRNILIGILIAIFAHSGWSAVNKQRVQHFDWNGLDVVWIEEERFPTYSLSVYFADGALSDAPRRHGETELMFDFLDLGTQRYSQRQIADALDFYGVTYGSYVTHEFSTFSVSGLTKDVVPTMKMICHMMNQATYPRKTLKREKRRVLSGIKAMVNNKRAIAGRAFRALSMSGTPYASVVSGTLHSLPYIRSKELQNKLHYFQHQVKKVLYISGPRELLNIKEIINKECGWENQHHLFVRKQNYKKKKFRGTQIYLVTVPNANQAQIRIGRFLNYDELADSELLVLAESFLGGGFTSILMNEVRVKRGLTYSIGAFAGAQAQYGRTGIFTFTKNKSVVEVIQVIKDVIARVSQQNFDMEMFDRSKGYLIGSYPFRFERSTNYMRQLISLDHRGIPYERFYDFPNIIEKYRASDIARIVKRLFDWKKQTIVVIGNKKLKAELKKLGRVKVISYKKFL